ncbi:MAG: sigma-70 family RNA polymerase sigma factor, partial [bacterium]
MVAQAENKTTPDLELAQRASRGNRVAALTLARRLLPRVRATVRYLVADDRDADDLVQMCLVEVLRVIGKYSGTGALERWADRVVARYALRQITRRRWREGIVTLDPERTGSAAASQHADLERQQLRQRVAALLGHLSPERRTVVVLHWVRGYSIGEVAEMTDTRVNTVRGRLRTAKRQLLELIPDDPVLRVWAEARL